MTGNEMAEELEIQLDRSSSFGSPGYEDFELSSVLTAAEQLYVKKFLESINNRKNESFEETEIRSQGLSALIKRGQALTVSSDQSGIISNGKFFDLPEDFMYTIHEEATINKNICNTETPITADIRIIGHYEISRFRENKYKKPFFKNYGEAIVWRLVYSREIDGHEDLNNRTNKRHQLVTDGTFEVDSYSINYLQNPKGIVVDRDDPDNQRNSILDESTHLVIVQMATDLMLDRVKEQKIQNIESFKEVE